ncbi:MAG: FtsQ-type POTRA domain-containing protein, partial [Proteobacteria bacterium]|nr:FtsQ-type POTRA domain-containing protein [Pseudomonadota bacterium]
MTVLVKSLCVLVLLGLIAASNFAARQLNEPIGHVSIGGSLTDAQRSEVQSAIAPVLGGSLMSTDLNDLKNRIADLSWPRSVEIRRVWPNRLDIMVEKEMVVAQWSDGSFVTSAGAFVNQPETSSQLPVFECELSAPGEAMEVYQMLKGIIGRDGLKVVVLNENAFGEWRVTLSGGLQVVLGAEHIAERLHRFLLAYRRVVAANIEQVEYVDARYPNGIAIRWRE